MRWKHHALWDAVYADDYPRVQRLLETPSGAESVNVPHGVWSNTAVHVAVQRGNRRILNILVVFKGDVNAININGTTPLHIAVETRNHDLVQYLLECDAKPNKRNFTRKSPLELARVMMDKDMAKMLQEKHNLDMGRRSSTADLAAMS
ncbi:hypothetical protein H257_06777 [Aphanomyces astaci]|uniref:Uncharacterized protein n=1 Tax=Aphanomyces astaci TaxID=112090 RepID=W4GMC1_APHAT|nr:hypothetical protein H257_06777 [Aphanomyces astaci]ETV80511.1 hypothetical protein H257_06777 [Aphanomyces astaci]|eukprot:XP_009830435.1 hypothetical protein H257_06777 [Aphanomyces astaci]